MRGALEEIMTAGIWGNHVERVFRKLTRITNEARGAFSSNFLRAQQ
jgi:hypothetical protein